MNTTSNLLEKETLLIQECIDGNRKSQFELYNLYAGKMYAICMRYAGNAFDAQEILQIGFIKVFSNLDGFRADGAFEGWLRRIFIYTCIEFGKKKPKSVTDDFEQVFLEDKGLTGFDKISMHDLLRIIQELPEGYRTVVNLFMVEGFSHKEISEMLGITENTSKSQLFRGKLALQKKISSFII